MPEEVLHGMSWEVFHARLEDALRGFDERGFVTLLPPAPPGTPEPEPEPEPEHGMLARLRSRFNRLRGHQQPPLSRPLVQLSYDGEALAAECSGPVSGRGENDFPWTPEQQRRLLELGWDPPDRSDYWHMYRWYGHEGENLIPQPVAAQQGAALVIATLRDVYGMANPDGLTFIVEKFP